MIKIVARSLVFNCLFYVNLIGLMLIGLPLLFWGPRGIFWLARTWGYTSLWLLRVICQLDVEYRGTKNIPKGGYIIAPKHQSIWETFALLPLFEDFTFILKRELIWIPIFGWYLKAANQIAINRARGSSALNEATLRAAEALEAGRSVFIFPEGTRRPAGAPPQYKFGVANIYATTGARCLPIALNSGLFWPRRSFLKNPGKVLVQVLPLIDSGLGKLEFLRQLSEQMEAATNELIRESIALDPQLSANLLPVCTTGA